MFFGAAGCSGRAELSEATERLLTSFANRDYKRFHAITTKRLPRAFRKERFSELADALHRLGKLGERRCEHAGAKAGGGYIGRFALMFASGAVSLEITIVGEKISAFRFSGPELTRALRLERQGLLIDGVAVADAKGRPAQVFDPKAPIVISLRLAGAVRDKRGNVDVRVEARTFRGRAAMSVNRHFAARKGRIRGKTLRMRGVLRLGPGRYRVTLTAFDQRARRHARGTVVFRVRGDSKTPTKAEAPAKPGVKASAKPDVKATNPKATGPKATKAKVAKPSAKTIKP
jgi:hypothetical protein